MEFFSPNVLKPIRHSTSDNREMNMKCRRFNESKKETRKGMKSETEESFDINYAIFRSLHEYLSWGKMWYLCVFFRGGGDGVFLFC